MRMLAEAGAIFVGQGVACDGVATYRDLEGVPAENRIEFPVAEELNVGFCTGLALQGILPVVVIPRFDFLLRAADQLVHHLDRLPVMSCGQFVPKVIIRTRVGAKTPLDPGPQHSNDYTEPFKLMLTTVFVERIDNPDRIIQAYKDALGRSGSTLVAEAI